MNSSLTGCHILLTRVHNYSSSIVKYSACFYCLTRQYLFFAANYKWRIYIYHPHQVMLITPVHSLSLSLSLSLSSSSDLSPSCIAPGRSSRLHPVFAQSWFMQVFAGRPILVCLLVRFHWRTSLLSSSLLPQQCLACFLRLGRFVRWKVSGRTVSVLQHAASWICSEKHVAFLCSSHLALSR